MKKIVLILLMTLGLFAFESEKVEHISVSNIKGENITLVNKGYDVCFNVEKRRPNFVVYTLNAEKANQRVSTKYMGFKTDFRVPKDAQVHSYEYAKLGLDRGHNANNADFDYEDEARRETYLLSNITPQTPRFNRYFWSRIERKARELATDYGDIEILSGSCREKIKINNLYVPKYWYKVLYIKEMDKTISFLVENTDYYGVNKDKKVTSFSIYDFLSTPAEISRTCGFKIQIK